MQIIRIPIQSMVLITASAMWDGINTRELVRQPALFIVDGRIKKICTGFEGSQIKQYPKFRHINFPHLTLLPGLVDAHVHLALDGTPAGKEKWHNPSGLAEMVDQNLHQSISSGILAVRDAGDRLGTGLLVKQKKIEVRPDIPQIVTTGPAIRRLNGYGQFLGEGIGEALEASEAITELKMAGADQVKLLASGIVSMRCFGKVGGQQFTREEIHLLAQMAKANGLPLMVHANSEPTISHVISANVKSIEHGYFVNVSSLKQMAETGTAWVPTVYPVAAMASTPEVDPNIVEKTYQRHLKMISIAQKIGVKLAIGTDAGSPGVYHGKSYIEELKLWAKAGIPTPAILKAATTTGAMVLGLDKSIGTIQVGKRPSLIGVQGNPLETIENLADIKAVLLPQDV
ncbi:MAG: amidohydrolase family protein [Bacillota bacterium]